MKVSIDNTLKMQHILLCGVIRARLRKPNNDTNSCFKNSTVEKFLSKPSGGFTVFYEIRSDLQALLDTPPSLSSVKALTRFCTNFIGRFPAF